MENHVYGNMYKREKTYWWDISKRLLVQQMISEMKLSPKTKFLDAGCGTGLMYDFLKTRFDNVVGEDKSPLSLKFCKQRGYKNLVRADFEKSVKGKNGEFGAIVCLDVMEHVENDERLTREFHRVLKKNGLLFITVPAYQFLWSHHDEILWHKRRYTKTNLSSLLTISGFRIVKSSYFFSFLLPPAILMFKIFKPSLGKMKKDSFDQEGLTNVSLLLAARIERFLINHLAVPAGLSIIIVAQKM